MLKTFVLIVMIAILAACTNDSLYKKGDNQFFEPREYYRSVIPKDSVGGVLFKKDGQIDQIKSELLQINGIKDSVVLSNGKITIVAIEPKAYDRLNKEELLQQMNDRLNKTAMTVKVTADTEFFQQAKQLRETRSKSSYEEWNEAVKQLFTVIKQ